MAFLCKSHYNLQQLNTSTAKLWRHGAGVEAPSNRRFPMVTRRCRCLPTLQGTDGSSTTSGKICKAPFVWWSGWTTGTAIWHERTSRCLGWLFLFGGFHCFIFYIYNIYIYISLSLFWSKMFWGREVTDSSKKMPKSSSFERRWTLILGPQNDCFSIRYVQFQMRLFLVVSRYLS